LVQPKEIKQEVIEKKSSIDLDDLLDIEWND
jgi:hypothetical protein